MVSTMPNFIPEDYIRLDEAFHLFRRYKRGPDCDTQPLTNEADIAEWREQYREHLDGDANQLIAAFMEGHLEACVRNNNTKSNDRILPVEWQTASWPTGVFFDEEVFEFHDSSIGKYSGKSAFVNKQTVEAWILGNCAKQMSARLEVVTPESVSRKRIAARPTPDLDTAKTAISSIGLKNFQSLRLDDKVKLIEDWCKSQVPPRKIPSKRTIQSALKKLAAAQ